MIFELLFVALFLASLIVFLTAVVLLVRGKRRGGMRLLGILGAVWGVYLAIVLLVSATSPQRVIPMKQDRCFDEMCFAVDHVDVVPELGPAGSATRAKGVFYVVTMRASSHSRGRAQSEGGLHALLWDSGKYFEVSPEGERAWQAANGEASPLTARLSPGESVLSIQVFDVPADLSAPGLVLSHGFTPGYFVIGESPLLHKPTIIELRPQ